DRRPFQLLLSLKMIHYSEHVITLLYLTLFSFYCSAPPRPLHSFPTRRSSDLVALLVSATSCATAGVFTKNALRAAPVIYDAEMRSEEHTSELQSRFDLVCRLLLEKKKYGTQLFCIDTQL